MIKNKKLLAVLCAAATVAGAVPMMSLPVFADSSRVITLGGDLTSEQIDTMLKYFGVSGTNTEDIYTITVTNKDEQDHLSSYIPKEQIGTRTVSCSYVKPTESGGIHVRTANLQYVTANMIASTLSDLGIQNCDVVAACPFQVSGTGALTGIMMAYETATGETLDETKKDIATQEVIVTKDLASDIGTVEAEYVVNQVKSDAIDANATDADEIQQIIGNVVENSNITITNEQIENITNLTQNIVNQNYGDTYIQNLTEINNNIAQEIDASENINIDVEVSDDTTNTTNEASSDSIVNQTDESVLGDNVIASSTDDATLVVETQTEQQTGEIANPENTTQTTDEIIVENTADEYNSSNEGTSAENTTDTNTEEDTIDETAENLETGETTEPADTTESTETTEAPVEDLEEIVENTNGIAVVDELQNILDKDVNEFSLPDNNITTHGYNITDIIDNAGEDTAKQFIKIEEYVTAALPYTEEDSVENVSATNEAYVELEKEDETQAEDITTETVADEAAAGTEIAADSAERTENISAAAKYILDKCHKFMISADTETTISDVLNGAAHDLIEAKVLEETQTAGISLLAETF